MVIELFNCGDHCPIYLAVSCVCFREYISSPLCLEEFLILHTHLVEKKTMTPDTIMPVLIGKVSIESMPQILSSFLKSHWYIDDRNGSRGSFVRKVSDYIQDKSELNRLESREDLSTQFGDDWFLSDDDEGKIRKIFMK